MPAKVQNGVIIKADERVLDALRPLVACCFAEEGKFQKDILSSVIVRNYNFQYRLFAGDLGSSRCVMLEPLRIVSNE